MEIEQIEQIADIAFVHIKFDFKSVHIFLVRKAVSKSCLMTEPCFHQFVHFYCIPTYVSGFHYK